AWPGCCDSITVTRRASRTAVTSIESTSAVSRALRVTATDCPVTATTGTSLVRKFMCAGAITVAPIVASDRATAARPIVKRGACDRYVFIRVSGAFDLCLLDAATVGRGFRSLRGLAGTPWRHRGDGGAAPPPACDEGRESRRKAADAATGRAAPRGDEDRARAAPARPCTPRGECRSWTRIRVGVESADFPAMPRPAHRGRSWRRIRAERGKR